MVRRTSPIRMRRLGGLNAGSATHNSNRHHEPLLRRVIIVIYSQQRPVFWPTLPGPTHASALRLLRHDGCRSNRPTFLATDGVLDRQQHQSLLTLTLIAFSPGPLWLVSPRCFRSRVSAIRWKHVLPRKARKIPYSEQVGMPVFRDQQAQC